MKFKENIALITLLSTVWVYLLGLCIFIGFTLVPITPSDVIIFNYLISAGKVFGSLLLVAIWLFAWYKAMVFVLNYELTLSTLESSLTASKDD